MITYNIPIFYIGSRALKVARVQDLLFGPLGHETIPPTWNKDFSEAVILCDMGPDLGERGELSILTGALIEGTVTHETYVICVPGAVDAVAEDTISFCLERGARLLYDGRYAGEICRKEIGADQDPTTLLRKYETSALMKDTSLMIVNIKGKLQLRWCGEVDDATATKIARKRLSSTTTWLTSCCRVWQLVANGFDQKQGNIELVPQPFFEDIIFAVTDDFEAWDNSKNHVWALLSTEGVWCIDDSVLRGRGDFDKIDAMMKRREAIMEAATSNIEEYIAPGDTDDVVEQARPYLEQSRSEMKDMFGSDYEHFETLARIRALSYAVGTPSAIEAYDAGVPADEIF